MARLEGAYEQVDKRLESIDRRLETLDLKIDTRFDNLDRKFDSKIDAFQWRMTSLIFGAWGTLMLAIFFHKV